MRDNIPGIILTFIFVFFVWGLGHLISRDQDRIFTFKQQCLEQGMQYMNGDCIR